MSKLARANCERGVSTLELTLAMPAVIFALLFLIGMGHALISKQHAVVGGQFAAHYQRVRESAPNAAAAGRAVSAGTETFRLSGGGDETISYTAKATPRQGLIAQLYRLKAANSQYQTSNVTNACVPNCKPFDSFARILSPEMITGLIFSGNTSGLPTGDLRSIVEGKGKKQPRQRPEGAEAPSPIKASEDNVPVVMAMASGGGGGKPPGGPPKGASGCGADGGNGNGGNGNGSNGNNGNAGNGKPKELDSNGRWRDRATKRFAKPEPLDILEEALRRQGFTSGQPYPAGFKEVWSAGGYKYEVRIHGPQADAPPGSNSREGPTYRIRRRRLAPDSQGQGSGWEYIDKYGNWHKQKFLKTSDTNPDADKAGNDVHIPVPGGNIR